MKLLVFLLVLLPFISNCQYQYIGTPQNIVLARAGLMADSSFYVGIHDTTFTPERIGCIVQRPQDNLLYEYNTLSSITRWYPLFVVFANNGLTKSGDTIQWGGTLIKNTLVDGTESYESRFTSANPLGSGRYTVTIKNTALFGNALRAEGIDGGIGVEGVSSTGYAGNFTSGSGPGLQASTGNNTAIIANVNPPSTNTIHQGVSIIRTTSGSPANGIGVSIDLANETSVTSRITNQIVSKLTDVTDTTRTSQFELYGVNNAVTDTILSIDGDATMTTYGRRKMAVVTNGDASLTLGNAEHYVFTGTTSVWTLPAVSGTSGLIYYIKNKGTGSITLNASGGENEIYTTSAVNTYEITAGSFIILISDGTTFNLKP